MSNLAAMIKLTFCLIRLPHLSRESFQDYWFNTHAPLVASVAGALRIRRYVQLHSLPAEANTPLRASRDAPPEYDGVAQLWYDSLDELIANRSPEASAAAAAKPKKERKPPGPCFHCGKLGHWNKECPTGAGRQVTAEVYHAPQHNSNQGNATGLLF